MSTETIRELKEIRGGAHSGASHVSAEGDYLTQDKKSNWFMWTRGNGGHCVSLSSSIVSPRALSDIDRIIALEEKVAALYELAADCGACPEYLRLNFAN